MNLDQLRAETPGAETAIYLNNAGVSLMPQPVIDAVQGYFALEAKIGGYPAMMQEQAAREAVYASVARLINARPSEIALMGSHTLAWTSMFYGMSFAEGDRILTSRSEYAANYVAFLQMRKRTGCEIKVIPSDNRGATNPAALEQMIDGKVKLIAVNWIRPRRSDVSRTSTAFPTYSMPARRWDRCPSMCTKSAAITCRAPGESGCVDPRVADFCMCVRSVSETSSPRS
jgi:selenocysteine lyase/cysteine desulfurase